VEKLVENLEKQNGKVFWGIFPSLRKNFIKKSWNFQ